MPDSFQGFAPESFRFFRDLARNNNKPWFDAHRDLYETHAVGVFRSLLATLQPFLLELNSNFEVSGKTNANFSRINRDIRFSKDKAPYKSNYYLYLYDARRSRKTDGYLYVGLSADCLTVGFAMYSAWSRGNTSALETIFRPHFTKERALFDRVLERSVRAKRYETYWHRMEKGDWAQHPGLPRADEDWLTLQGWIVRKVFQPQDRRVGSPALAGQIDNIFRDLYPLYVFTSQASPRWQQEVKKRLL
jgi:uncharacterized protein (TIGR02453 family)